MPTLMNLPNELLLSIIANVSPAYFDSFVLTCTRIHALAADAIREHKGVKRWLAALDQNQLLQMIVLDPAVAPYLTTLKLHTPSWQFFLSRPRSLALFTSLSNLRRFEVLEVDPSYLPETMSRIVQAYYEPDPTSFHQPLALDMLKVVKIHGTFHNQEGMKLAILLSMIPSVRRLDFCSRRPALPYSCRLPNIRGGVAELSVWGHVDPKFLAELILRTCNLQEFSYHHDIDRDGRNHRGDSDQLQTAFFPSHILQTLDLQAGHSLTHLDLSILKRSVPQTERHLFRRHAKNLCLGPLQAFQALRTMVISVDFLTETTVSHQWYRRGSGRVRRLVDTMPSSLQSLTLNQGLELWDRSTMRDLLAGISRDKEKCLPSLTMVDFMDCSDICSLMADHTKAECQSVGMHYKAVKLYDFEPSRLRVWWTGRRRVDRMREAVVR